MDEEKIPEDLGIIIGTKDQVLWETVKKEALVLMQQSEDNLKIQKEILKIAEKRIAEEKEKFK